MESWKNYQTQNRKEVWLTRTKTALIALGIIVVLGQFILLGNWLIKPISPNVKRGFSAVEYSTENQINLLVSPNWFIGVDQANRLIKYFQITDESDLKLNTDILAKKNKIILDGYLLTDTHLENLDNLQKYLLASIFSGSTNTNLTRWQIVSLWWWSRGGFVESLQSKYTLPEDRIAEENLKILVQNGTDIPGFAQDYAEWLDNVGAEVIEISNAEGRYAQTLIEVYLPKKDYQTLNRLEQIFGKELTWKDTNQPKREDVRVILGKDLSE